MSGAKLAAFEDKAMSAVMSPGGMRTLKVCKCMGMKPDGALCCVVHGATRIQTIERVEEIVNQMIDNPKVRGRLRQAGYPIQVRNEFELAEIGRGA